MEHVLSLNAGRKKMISSRVQKSPTIKHPSENLLGTQQRLSSNKTLKTKQHRKYFDEIATQLRIQKQEDWYSLKTKTLVKIEGHIGPLYKNYNGSISLALQMNYPEFEWHPWKFSTAPQKYWNSKGNQRKYFDWIADELNIQTQEEFYSVTVAELRDRGGWGLINNYYSQSLFKALESIYPEFIWLPWHSSNSGHAYWKDLHHRKKYFEWLGEVLSIDKMEDWYGVSSVEFIQHNGRGLIGTTYRQQMIYGLLELYPDYPWQVWRFQRVPKGYWKPLQHQRNYFDWLTSELHIEKPEHWLKVKLSDVHAKHGKSLLIQYDNSLQAALKSVYPEYDWTAIINMSNAQKYIWHELRKIFGEGGVLVNYRHPKLLYPGSLSSMELDVYIPSLQIAVEYNGEQHYYDNGYHQKHNSHRDEVKKAVCQSLGITLLQVPYWWNLSPSTLFSTISQLRPDISHSFNYPIISHHREGVNEIY